MSLFNNKKKEDNKSGKGQKNTATGSKFLKPNPKGQASVKKRSTGANRGS
jgi:hypothetical protein